MSLPEVIFSNWIHWRDRSRLDRGGEPGVYILAHFSAPPAGLADPLGEEVIYIGETHDNSLLRRLQQFHRSAFEGKPGHDDGLRYQQLYHDEGVSLFVAAFPAGQVSDQVRPIFIRHVERRLLFDFAMKWNHPPWCNPEEKLE